MIPKYLAEQMNDGARLLKAGKINAVRFGLTQSVRLLSERESTPAIRILTMLLNSWIGNLMDPSAWTVDRIHAGLIDVAKDIEEQPCA